ncbi:hypothetical protein D1AOALGA4SA_12246 [Olavius algarvensis Delta 1 endosymbiont]|nr:hypothetical protein D1AOALGA4SA_12246 [Olavius algarvensis Delta 1 endosymbiont]
MPLTASVIMVKIGVFDITAKGADYETTETSKKINRGRFQEQRKYSFVDTAALHYTSFA